MNNIKKISKKGFTLIEILVVIGIIAILAAVVLVAINPGRQFAQARNSQRISNVNSLLNAISQNSADNKGLFSCTASTTIPTTITEIKSGIGGFDLRGCIVPTYITEIPVDPSNGLFTSGTNYDTGYQILQDIVTKRVTVTAPNAELGERISVSR